MCLGGSMEGTREVETGCVGYWLAARVNYSLKSALTQPMCFIPPAVRVCVCVFVHTVIAYK